MPSNNNQPTPNPREQLEAMMNETFGERTPRKLFKLCTGEFNAENGAENWDLFEEYFYLSDEEAVEVCRGLINSLKPYASRRADREGRPKNAAVQGKSTPQPQQRQSGNRRDPQHAEERELMNA